MFALFQALSICECRGRGYLSWSQARSWLSQLSLVLVQSLFGSLILWVEEQDTEDIFHGLRHVPHCSWRKVRRGQKQTRQNTGHLGRLPTPGSPSPTSGCAHPALLSNLPFNGRVQRRGIREKMKGKAEATRAEGASNPSPELRTMVPKDTILKPRSPEVLTVKLAMQSRKDRRDR